jgi:hypothetical protein
VPGGLTVMGQGGAGVVGLGKGRLGLTLVRVGCAAQGAAGVFLWPCCVYATWDTRTCPTSPGPAAHSPHADMPVGPTAQGPYAAA